MLHWIPPSSLLGCTLPNSSALPYQSTISATYRLQCNNLILYLLSGAIFQCRHVAPFLQSYHCRSLLFSCHVVNNSDSNKTSEQEWTVDVHPKGLWFQKAIICGWGFFPFFSTTTYYVEVSFSILLYTSLYLHMAAFLRFQGAEIPEKVLRTVRVSVSTHSKVIMYGVCTYLLLIQ